MTTFRTYQVKKSFMSRYKKDSRRHISQKGSVKCRLEYSIFVPRYIGLSSCSMLLELYINVAMKIKRN